MSSWLNSSRPHLANSDQSGSRIGKIDVIVNISLTISSGIHFKSLAFPDNHSKISELRDLIDWQECSMFSQSINLCWLTFNQFPCNLNYFVPLFWWLWIHTKPNKNDSLISLIEGANCLSSFGLQTIPSETVALPKLQMKNWKVG
jgi:hypothetical protein